MRSLTHRRVLSSPLLITVLLVLAAALFGIGVALEHGGGETRRAAATSESAGHGDTGREGSQSAGHSETAESERVLGIELESPATVTAAVVVSLLLATVVWHYPRRPVLLAVALFAAGAAVFDAAEVAHQWGAEHADLAMLALLVAVLHVAVAVATGALVRRPVRLVSA